MNAATWDFSKYGVSAAVQEFIVSFFKTLAVAAAAFATLRLGNINIPLHSANFELYTVLIGLGRALISSFLVWVNTPAPTALPAAAVSLQG